MTVIVIALKTVIDTKGILPMTQTQNHSLTKSTQILYVPIPTAFQTVDTAELFGKTSHENKWRRNQAKDNSLQSCREEE